jgi:CheY-like chemotaxis protein
MQLGYTVTATAASGAEAIQKAGEMLPDLALIDIRLRGKMSGIEAAQQIQFHFGIPVIYLTAMADPDTVRQAEATGPSGFILKPFEESELRAAINQALKQRRGGKGDPYYG